jgi:hypothetical protein
MREIIEPGLPDPQRLSAHPQGVGVVEDENALVGRQPQVALYARAHPERRGEGGKAVLGGAGTMQSAMRKAEGARLKRVSL